MGAPFTSKSIQTVQVISIGGLRLPSSASVRWDWGGPGAKDLRRYVWRYRSELVDQCWDDWRYQCAHPPGAFGALVFRRALVPGRKGTHSIRGWFLNMNVDGSLSRSMFNHKNLKDHTSNQKVAGR